MERSERAGIGLSCSELASPPAPLADEPFAAMLPAENNAPSGAGAGTSAAEGRLDLAGMSVTFLRNPSLTLKDRAGQRLLEVSALDEQHLLLGVYFFQLYFDNFTGSCRNIPADECCFDRQLAVASVNKH